MKLGLKWIALVVLGAIMVVSGGRAEEAGRPLNLDLTKCVQMALDINVSVLRAKYELDRSKSGLLTSASQILPAVGISSQHEKYESSFFRQVGDKVIETDKSYSYALYLRETLSWGGVMGVLESAADKGAAEENLRKAKQDVAFLAKQKYLEVLKAQRLLGVREEALDLSRRQLEKAQALVEVGSAVRSDVLRAQVEMSRNELDLISARNSLRLAQTDLRHFLGIDEEVALELEDILEAADIEYALDAAIAEATAGRPDVKSARQSLKARATAVWAERGGWFPAADFRWYDRYTGQDFPDQLSSLWDDSEWSWYFTISINLFDGLETFSRVKTAKAWRRSAQEDLRQLKRDVALEIRRAFYNVEEARQRVKVSSETVSLAQEELRLAEERYRLGGGTMLEQIDSQVALSEARTAHIEALYDYMLSQAELDKAMGKD